MVIKEVEISRQESQELCVSSSHWQRSQSLQNLALSTTLEKITMQEKDVIETQQQSNHSYSDKYQISEVIQNQVKGVRVQKCLIPRPIKCPKEKIKSEQTRIKVKIQRTKLCRCRKADESVKRFCS